MGDPLYYLIQCETQKKHNWNKNAILLSGELYVLNSKKLQDNKKTQ